MGTLQMVVFPGCFASIAVVYRATARAAHAVGFSARSVHLMQVAVWEGCSNIIRHAYQGEGVGNITFVSSTDGAFLTMVLRDTGRAFSSFDLLTGACVACPSLQASGGRGLYMIRQIMDEVFYCRADQGVNVFTMRKRYA